MSTTRAKTKVVVRNLPPGMTEDTFKAVMENLAGGRYTWLSYFPGKFSLKRVVFSRAYVNFTTSEEVFEFKQRFDGHVFIGQKGHQYRCSVEYAPLQKVPVQEGKPHPLEGTIEKDAEYLAFLEAYESGQPLPSPAAPGASATEMPAATLSCLPEGGEGKVVMSRLMEYLVRKYAEGGNRLGGMRAATKAKQSKLDLIQQVQVPAQAGRGATATKAARAAAAAAITAAVTADAAATKSTRKERDRSTKAASSEASASKSGEKPQEKQHVASRGTSGKGARHSAAEAPKEAATPTVTLLTRAGGAQSGSSKGHGKDQAVEKPRVNGTSGSGRSDARLSQQTGSRTAGTEAEGSAASGEGHEGGKGRGAGAGRTAVAQQSAARGGGQGETPLVVRPVAASTPRLLLVKGGEARRTQATSSSGQSAPAQPAPPASGAISSTTMRTAHEPQGPRQQQQQSQPRSSKQPSTLSMQERQEESSGAGAAPTSVQLTKSSTKSQPPPPASAEDGANGKTNATASASAAATGSRAAAPTPASTPAPATVVAALAVSGAGAPSEGSAPDDGLAATASAAATAALTAAAARASAKKVRAGFQMYVPGSLKGRAPGGGAGGNSTTG